MIQYIETYITHSFEELLLCVIYRYMNSVYIGLRAPNKLITKIKKVTGINVSGYNFCLTARYMKHFYDRHIMNAETNKKNIPMQFEDIRFINEILRDPTMVIEGNKANTVVVKKKYLKGVYDLVLQIDTKNKQLLGTSFRLNARLNSD